MGGVSQKLHDSFTVGGRGGLVFYRSGCVGAGAGEVGNGMQ